MDSSELDDMGLDYIGIIGMGEVRRITARMLLDGNQKIGTELGDIKPGDEKYLAKLIYPTCRYVYSRRKSDLVRCSMYMCTGCGHYDHKVWNGIGKYWEFCPYCGSRIVEVDEEDGQPRA